MGGSRGLAIVEWWDEYIAYDTLKKYSYQLEKQQHEGLVQARPRWIRMCFFAPYSTLSAARSRPLRLCCRKKELFEELAELEVLVQVQDELGLVAG
ncbi:hypothetical protein OF83DRAFT_1178125 [Amylostereum chailletii]|nr:hypothetical protein OF83DRAFT_1178125 [Amylostereum chailletii]